MNVYTIWDNLIDRMSKEMFIEMGIGLIIVFVVARLLGFDIELRD